MCTRRWARRDRPALPTSAARKSLDRRAWPLQPVTQEPVPVAETTTQAPVTVAEATPTQTNDSTPALPKPHYTPMLPIPDETPVHHPGHH